jgi:hypothetical protein
MNKRIKKTLRDYLTQARETAEKAVSDQETISAIDADALPSIARSIRQAMRCLDRDTDNRKRRTAAGKGGNK